MTDDDICELCAHSLDPHLVVATGEKGPTAGGVILCHVKGCQCYSTWSLPQLGGTKESVIVPDKEQLAEMRRTLQHG